MTKTIGKEIKTTGKKVGYPIYLADEVRNRFINLDLSKYDIKGKSILILIYCKLVSYRIAEKHEIVSVDMDRIASDVKSTRQYVGKCIDILIEEGFLASTKNGTVGSSSTYSFPLEPSKGYSRMKFNEYNNKKKEDIKLINGLNKLSPGAKALYCIMKNNSYFSILSARGGGKYLGLSSHSTILKYLKELEDTGMIFSNGQERYFPQEFEYEIDDVKVDTSKNNDIEIKKLEMLLKDAEDKNKTLEDKNNKLNSEIRRLQNSSEAEELKELKREVTRLTSELEKERKPNKVICKNRTKKELEIYIDQLEETVNVLETERAQAKGFEDAGEYDLFERIKQRCDTLTRENQKLELELSKYKDDFDDDFDY